MENMRTLIIIVMVRVFLFCLKVGTCNKMWILRVWPARVFGSLASMLRSVSSLIVRVVAFVGVVSVLSSATTTAQVKTDNQQALSLSEPVIKMTLFRLSLFPSIHEAKNLLNLLSIAPLGGVKVPSTSNK